MFFLHHSWAGPRFCLLSCYYAGEGSALSISPRCYRPLSLPRRQSTITSFRNSRPSSHTPSVQHWQAVLNYYQLRTSFQLNFYATPLSINSQFKDVPVEYSSGIPYLRSILRPSLDFVLLLLLYRIVIIYNFCNTILSFRYLFYMQM